MFTDFASQNDKKSIFFGSGFFGAPPGEPWNAENRESREEPARHAARMRVTKVCGLSELAESEMGENGDKR